MKNYTGNAATASPRPWHIEHVTRQKEAVIKADDGAVVAVCHADNAEEIVRCVNEAEIVAEKDAEIARLKAALKPVMEICMSDETTFTQQQLMLAVAVAQRIMKEGDAK